MKALIAAGGRATRMRPISHTTNKHLIPLANEPMIWNALAKIAEAGITDIFINVNPGETELQKAVGDGSRWGVRVTFVEQTGGPKGLAHIVSNAQPYIGDEPFLFYLGDNIILGSLKEFVDTFVSQNLDCLLALSRVKDPQRFGVPEFVDGKLVRVVEKPEHPKSEFAVAGIYVYSPKIFEAASAIQPSGRGEYEISDAHTWLIEHGAQVGTKEITGWWKDTGKHGDLLEGNALLLAESVKVRELEGATILDNVTLEGGVRIGAGSTIGPNVTIRGPVAIGKDCIVRDATIGAATSIGSGSTIVGADIERSILFRGVSVDCPERIVDSIIGANVQIRSAEPATGHRLIVGDDGIVEW